MVVPCGDSSRHSQFPQTASTCLLLQTMWKAFSLIATGGSVTFKSFPSRCKCQPVFLYDNCIVWLFKNKIIFSLIFQFVAWIFCCSRYKKIILKSVKDFSVSSCLGESCHISRITGHYLIPCDSSWTGMMSRAAKMGWEEKQPHKTVLVGKGIKYIAHSLTKLLWALNRLGMRAETK